MIEEEKLKYIEKEYEKEMQKNEGMTIVREKMADIFPELRKPSDSRNPTNPKLG